MNDTVLLRRIAAIGAASLALGSGHSFAAQGDLDPDFGDHGRVRVDLPGEERNSYSQIAAALQPDGGLVITRSGPDLPRIHIVRLLADGRVDTTFGTGGYAHTDFGTTPSIVYNLVVQPDGRILLAGRATSLDGASSGVVLALNSDGSLDESFAERGRSMLMHTRGVDEQVVALVTTASGHIVLAVEQYTPDGSGFAIERLTADGAVDSRFGYRGRTVFSSADFDSFSLDVHEIVELPDGQLVACVTRGDLQAFTGAVPGTMLAIRLLADGSRDPSFGHDGVAVAGSGYTDSCVAQPDGGVVLVADSIHAVRLLPDGSVDESFAGDGLFEHSLGVDPDFQGLGGFGYYNVASDIETLPDGRLAVGALAGDYEPAVVVIESGGAPSTSFGRDGLRKIDNGFDGNGLLASQLRLVTGPAGIVVISAQGDTVTVARLNADDRPGATVVGFRELTNWVRESAGSLVHTVHRSGSSEGSVSVSFRTADGTAVAGEDYTATRGSLVWADGDAAPQEIAIPLVDDRTSEPQEHFSILLEAPLGAALSASRLDVSLNDPQDPPSDPPSAPTSGRSDPVPAAGGGALDPGSLGLLALAWLAATLRRFRPARSAAAVDVSLTDAVLLAAVRLLGSSRSRGHTERVLPAHPTRGTP